VPENFRDRKEPGKRQIFPENALEQGERGIELKRANMRGFAYDGNKSRNLPIF